MIYLDGYDVIRKRQVRHGGGVCIYLCSSINYKIRDDFIPSELEGVCVEIIKAHIRPFLVTTIYRPPNSANNFIENIKKFVKTIDDENKVIYILGDFNCNILKTECDTATKNLKSFCDLYQMSQLIKEGTQITMTSSSLIDHIVNNAPERISDTGVIHTGISDHRFMPSEKFTG